MYHQTINLKYILILTICTIVSLVSLGQPIPDISGKWNGTARVVLGSDMIIEYDLEQEGAIIKGYGIRKSIHQKDSSKVLLQGLIDSNSINLKETKFIYKTDASCLSNIKLTWKQETNQQKLIGKWYGDWSMQTCPPSSSGAFELIRLSSPTLTLDKQVTSEQTNQKKLDSYGDAMMDRLKQIKYYALFIGINQYEDHLIPNLDHPVADMKRIQEVLNTYYHFEWKNSTALVNPTRDEIIFAFDSLQKKLTSNDQLLIFYAGHGFWDPGMKQGYWLPSDAQKQSKARWLSNSTIRDYIGGISSKHTLLITDACFSGGIFKERSIDMGNNKAIVQMYKLASRKAMTSGTLTTVPDQSIFIQYLLKSLKTNDQILLSAEELFSSFKIAVINNSPTNQVPQYGAIGQVGDEGGDFIFLKDNTD